jgi:hypothetical protein
MRVRLRILATAVLASGGVAHAAVFRCTADDGRVTYQDTACAPTDEAVATGIPTQYPPVNDAERARILEREAELERRLEARRERAAREAAVRIATAPPEPAPPPPEPVLDAYPLFVPYYLPPHRPHRPHGPRGHRSHRDDGPPTSGRMASRP